MYVSIYIYLYIHISDILYAIYIAHLAACPFSSPSSLKLAEWFPAFERPERYRIYIYICMCIYIYIYVYTYT